MDYPRTTPAPRTTRLALRAGGALLLALLGLAVVPGTRAGDACSPEFRAGTSVWYRVETLPRESRSFDSGCTQAAGPGGEVAYYVRSGRIVIACDLPLALPAAMQAELAEVRRQDATGLPSRRRQLDDVWSALVRRFSAELTCAPGFARMGSAGPDTPSLWCRRTFTAHELCPQPGGTYTEGACYTMACPAGTVDLETSTGGRLAGCSRCPAGRLDVAESLAWRDPSWSSSSHGPATAVLCRAKVSDPCPGTP